MNGNDDFPRSHLLRAVRDHPVAIAAAVATVAFVGPAAIGRVGRAGLECAARNAPAIAPLLEAIARARLSR